MKMSADGVVRCKRRKAKEELNAEKAEDAEG